MLSSLYIILSSNFILCPLYSHTHFIFISKLNRQHEYITVYNKVRFVAVQFAKFLSSKNDPHISNSLMHISQNNGSSIDCEPKGDLQVSYNKFKFVTL